MGYELKSSCSLLMCIGPAARNVSLMHRPAATAKQEQQQIRVVKTWRWYGIGTLVRDELWPTAKKVDLRDDTSPIEPAPNK
jgi:hypothetical protein